MSTLLAIFPTAITPQESNTFTSPRLKTGVMHKQSEIIATINLKGIMRLPSVYSNDRILSLEKLL